MPSGHMRRMWSISRLSRMKLKTIFAATRIFLSLMKNLNLARALKRHEVGMDRNRKRIKLGNEAFNKHVRKPYGK
jgi:hypothetical protein